MDERVIQDISYGMYIVGTAANNTLAGCVVNSVIQISSEPKKIAVSLNHNNYTTACIQNTREFTVSILTENAPKELITKFGFSTSREDTKFGGTEFRMLMNNMPVLTKYVSGWLHCKVENIVDTGTHAIFIAEVIDAEKISDDKPMTYEYYHREIKGTAPKNAPTYHREQTDSGEYVCDICGYVYKDGDFADLPEDWVCPICGVGKDKFTAK